LKLSFLCFHYYWLFRPLKLIRSDYLFTLSVTNCKKDVSTLEKNKGKRSKYAHCIIYLIISFALWSLDHPEQTNSHLNWPLNSFKQSFLWDALSSNLTTEDGFYKDCISQAFDRIGLSCRQSTLLNSLRFLVGCCMPGSGCWSLKQSNQLFWVNENVLLWTFTTQTLFECPGQIWNCSFWNKVKMSS
jgi:hypothetical protein